jgi:hypothetical protein
MTAADRNDRSNELIGLSESLRNELIVEVEKLEHFVAALQQAVEVQTAERRRRNARDR